MAGLGDQVERALKLVGITKERVEAFMGKPCGCGERREKLNRLGKWAYRILLGKTEDAEKHLDAIIDSPKVEEKPNRKGVIK